MLGGMAAGTPWMDLIDNTMFSACAAPLTAPLPMVLISLVALVVNPHGQGIGEGLLNVLGLLYLVTIYTVPLGYFVTLFVALPIVLLLKRANLYRQSAILGLGITLGFLTGTLFPSLEVREHFAYMLIGSFTGAFCAQIFWLLDKPTESPHDK
jgi:hypothetical protein